MIEDISQDHPDRMRIVIALNTERCPDCDAHAKLYADAEGKVEIGEVTSGGFGPSAESPVAMDAPLRTGEPLPTGLKWNKRRMPPDKYGGHLRLSRGLLVNGRKK